VPRSYRFVSALAAVALAAGASTAFADGGHGRDGRDNNGNNNNNNQQNLNNDIINSDVFGSMPNGPVLFNAKPGGAPWVISRGQAELGRDGRLEVKVEGLVIPTAPQNGTNPVPQIAATVYCNGMPVATTYPVGFSNAGNAEIEQTVYGIPTPCLAPAVLLNPASAGVIAKTTYIAATGE
jgi:hypothetical protein